MIAADRKLALNFFADSFIHSYSQMFFSDNRIFAYLILISSFVNPYSGFSGVFALTSGILIAWWLGFNKTYLQTGVYSFNSLMIGLVMGLYFNFSIQFFIIRFVISIFTTLLSKAIAIVFSKYNLPILAFPFLLSVWALIVALRTSHVVTLSQTGIFVNNELYSLGGIHLVEWFQQLDALPIPRWADAYFKSLGAIYFQYNIISGLLIAVGLLIYSRIAFTLSVIGFITGYYFFQFLNGTAEPLNYNFIGFNYILSAICIGGFFLIPSKKSYLLALLTAPIIAIMHTSMMVVFGYLQLPIYSLPFNVILIVLLLTLKYRTESNQLELVWIQQFSPEKNLYKHHNGKDRFSHQSYFPIHLPFFGEWYVSQGHDGNITHKEEWKYAWDFVVTDDMKKTFRLPGTSVNDFYCYNAPILAPADGYVYDLVDEIEDNPIGGVDLEHNWGNTLIIKHSDTLYSKLSHLRKGSFKVKPGDYVHKGEVVATCGSSGRSPEPHIHFQLQATPFVGSKTMKYPISYYVEKREADYLFHSFDFPEERSTISGIQITPTLKNAFDFIPGKELKFEVSTSDKSKKQLVKWEIFTDTYNHPYLYCHQSKAYAYFVNNGTVHYFTDFYGDKKSLLYQFYLGAYKILLGYYDRIEVSDVIPMSGFYSGAAKFLQDFIAPFHIYLKVEYSSKFKIADDLHPPTCVLIESTATVHAASGVLKKTDFEISVVQGKISSFRVTNNNQTISAQCIS